ncbi:MAG: hypothetical protein AAGM67_04860 [Bacteroidota bacterium]
MKKKMSRYEKDPKKLITGYAYALIIPICAMFAYANPIVKGSPTHWSHHMIYAVWILCVINALAALVLVALLPYREEEAILNEKEDPLLYGRSAIRVVTAILLIASGYVSTAFLFIGSVYMADAYAESKKTVKDNILKKLLDQEESEMYNDVKA